MDPFSQEALAESITFADDCLQLVSHEIAVAERWLNRERDAKRRLQAKRDAWMKDLRRLREPRNEG